MTTESDIKTVERLIYAPEFRVCEALAGHRHGEEHATRAPCVAAKRIVEAWERLKTKLTETKEQP